MLTWIVAVAVCVLIMWIMKLSDVPAERKKFDLAPEWYDMPGIAGHVRGPEPDRDWVIA